MEPAGNATRKRVMFQVQLLEERHARYPCLSLSHLIYDHFCLADKLSCRVHTLALLNKAYIPDGNQTECYDTSKRLSCKSREHPDAGLWYQACR